jgi:hypothetical protein
MQDMEARQSILPTFSLGYILRAYVSYAARLVKYACKLATILGERR